MDNKNSILLVDPEFDLNTAADCDLLLKITPDSFSYAIIDKGRRQLKAVYDEQECNDVPAMLAIKLKNDVYLTLAFKEIKAAVYTENSINVPNELFDPQQLNQYAKFFTETQSNNLYTRPFKTFGFTSIFTLQQFTEETLTTSLSNCKLYAQNAPVLTLAAQSDKTILLLDFTASSFNALYSTGEKLIFQNYYQTDNAEEFNYYLLLIVSQLNINTANTEVQLSGIIHSGDDYYQCIAKYFNNISFNCPPVKELDHKILDDMPAHYYSSLLALDLCE
ncbi:MAG: DUF3822 family protein [Candidatus Pedobacter colombiensis]|uniref:DUF3822 family protein n=1 Tax=Candidatus Pedobacter colombiensis TaxID=3121371 RepID=A0AAJ5WBX9_9SPHI|nr:DUF3822 family protein [Pedobacter sp.]WEK20654.1 MAG: DUF3822 family protein [Pedobacter sp.]